tara:strand:+ start:1014 stop:1544 length:531 start_codon:yes stop_codon:yes gene_type:complete
LEVKKKDESKNVLQDKVVSISRVAKVVKGGRRFSFSSLVVVGDGESRVGFGVGKAGEVPDAIRKGSEQAKKNLVDIPHVEGTLPYEVYGRHGSSSVMMSPAKKGKGIIAGGAVRMVVELAGIKDIVCKIHGSKNGHNVVRATLDGLQQLMVAENRAKERGVELAIETTEKKEAIAG